jgi:putative transposase
MAGDQGFEQHRKPTTVTQVLIDGGYTGEQFGMQASMSRKGNCYDNAPMASFWGLKNEMIHHQRYATRANAESAIKEYIEIFYNRQRRHSRLGYVSPASFAENFNKKALAA